MLGWFFEVCRKRGVKVNGGKRKVMTLNREERLECEVYVHVICLDQILEFKYLRYVLDESCRDRAVCSRKVVRGRRVAGAIRSLVNNRDLQLDLTRVLHETLHVSVLMYRIVAVLWKERKRKRQKGNV